MKILMPILHYPPVIGGVEVFSQNTAERIGKTEDVFVVTSAVIDAPKGERKNKLRIYRTAPWPLKDLAYSKPWFILGAMIWILVKSFKLIKKEKIELIHSQGFLSGILGYILKKIAKIPYIITIQSADFSVYHPRLNINIVKWFYQKIEKVVFKNARAGHTPSYHLEKHFKKYKIQKTIVIPNGVDLKKFKPDPQKKKTRKELGFDTEILIAACDSRLEHKNGAHDVVEAAKYLKDLDFKIIIIGDGPDREKLEKMIEKFNLKKQVILLGYILHSKVPRYIASADIFVRPSLAEGFGISFIQAMATETAVIGTPVGGIPDFLHERETGLFCEPGNPKDIADKIRLLIRDKELRERLIKNAKKMIEEAYNWDKVSRQLISVYKEIIHV